jgi:hypothetical protein
MCDSVATVIEHYQGYILFLRENGILSGEEAMTLRTRWKKNKKFKLKHNKTAVNARLPGYRFQGD